MARRTVTESEWLTRSTAPLRLARSIQTRITSRRLQILSAAACRLIERHINHPSLREELDRLERFAFRSLVDDPQSIRLIEQTEWDNLALEFNAYDERDMAAFHALAAAKSSAVVAGMIRTFEWVLLAGRDDPDLPAHLCDLIREICGNPFRHWTIPPPWLAAGQRIDPAGNAFPVSTAVIDLAMSIDCNQRFDTMPILADELESSGWTDPAILHHLRSGSNHRRGCWAIDVILGRE